MSPKCCSVSPLEGDKNLYREGLCWPAEAWQDGSCGKKVVCTGTLLGAQLLGAAMETSTVWIPTQMCLQSKL